MIYYRPGSLNQIRGPLNHIGRCGTGVIAGKLNMNKTRVLPC